MKFSDLCVSEVGKVVICIYIGKGDISDQQILKPIISNIFEKALEWRNFLSYICSFKLKETGVSYLFVHGHLKSKLID